MEPHFKHKQPNKSSPTFHNSNKNPNNQSWSPVKNLNNQAQKGGGVEGMTNNTIQSPQKGDQSTYPTSSHYEQQQQHSINEPQDQSPMPQIDQKQLIREQQEQMLREQIQSIREMNMRNDFGFGFDPSLTGDRASLVMMFTKNIKLSHGPATSVVIEPPSSGEESEDEIVENSSPNVPNKPGEQQKIEIKGTPGFQEIVERLFEPTLHLNFVVRSSQFKTHLIKTELKEVPKGLVPLITIMNIEQYMPAKRLKDKIDQYSLNSKIELIQPQSVRIFISPNNPNCLSKFSGLIQYKSLEEVQKMYQILNQCFQNVKNMDNQQPLKVYYAYDKRYLFEEKWVGVVVRNLPPDCTQEIILRNFKSTDHYTVVKAEQPMTIRGFRCAILQLKDIEQAEKFCLKWNNFAFNEAKRLKAHIHPLSNTWRPNPLNSHQNIFVSQAKKLGQNSLFHQTPPKMPTFGTELDKDRRQQQKQNQLNQINESTEKSRIQTQKIDEQTSHQQQKQISSDAQGNLDAQTNQILNLDQNILEGITNNLITQQNNQQGINEEKPRNTSEVVSNSAVIQQKKDNPEFTSSRQLPPVSEIDPSDSSGLTNLLSKLQNNYKQDQNKVASNAFQKHQAGQPQQPMEICLQTLSNEYQDQRRHAKLESVVAQANNNSNEMNKSNLNIQGVDGTNTKTVGGISSDFEQVLSNFSKQNQQDQSHVLAQQKSKAQEGDYLDELINNNHKKSNLNKRIQQQQNHHSQSDQKTSLQSNSLIRASSTNNNGSANSKLQNQASNTTTFNQNASKTSVIGDFNKRPSLQAQNNINQQAASLKPKDQIKSHDYITSKAQDTKDSSQEDKLLGKRKQPENANILAANNQNVKALIKQRKNDESSEEDDDNSQSDNSSNNDDEDDSEDASGSSSSDGEYSESDSSQDNKKKKQLSQQNTSRPQKRRSRALQSDDDEDVYDAASNKLISLDLKQHSSNSNAPQMPKKRGRPSKQDLKDRKKAEKELNRQLKKQQQQSSSNNNSFSNNYQSKSNTHSSQGLQRAQQFQGLGDQRSSSNDQAPVKRGRGRPPKRQHSISNNQQASSVSGDAKKKSLEQQLNKDVKRLQKRWQLDRVWRGRVKCV